MNKIYYIVGGKIRTESKRVLYSNLLNIPMDSYMSSSRFRAYLEDNYYVIVPGDSRLTLDTTYLCWGLDCWGI